MASRSTVFDLSPELREELNRLLRARVTLDAIVAHLRTLTEAAPSRSAIGRYARQFEAIAARVKRSQDITDRLVADLGPQIADGKGLQVLAQGFQSLAFDLLAGMGETTLDPENLMFFARSIGEVSRALKTDADRSLSIRRAALKDAAAAVKAEIGGEAGLSAETADFVMQKILGVAA